MSNITLILIATVLLIPISYIMYEWGFKGGCKLQAKVDFSHGVPSLELMKTASNEHLIKLITIIPDKEVKNYLIKVISDRGLTYNQRRLLDDLGSTIAKQSRKKTQKTIDLLNKL